MEIFKSVDDGGLVNETQHISLDRHHGSQDLELHFSSVEKLKDWGGSLRDIMSARVNLDEVPRDYGICKTKPIM